MGTDKRKVANVTPVPGTQIQELDATHFGSTLRRYRELAQLEQAEVARVCGVKQNAVSNWENGRSRPSLSLVPILCQFLDIPLEVFFNLPTKVQPAAATAEGTDLSTEEETLINGYRRLSAVNRWQLRRTLDLILETQHKARRIELRETFCRLCGHDLSLAAGFGIPLDDDADTFPMFVRTSRTAERADDIFPVSGHSMEPDYPDGSMVFVKRVDVDALNYGDIIACICDGTPFVKVFEKDGLHSLNAEYSAISVSDDDNFRLIGQVIGLVPEGDLASKAETEELMEAFAD